MRIILRVYKEIRLGNLSTMTIDIPNNKITVRDFKEKIFKKYKIKTCEQKLTFRLCHKKLITLNDCFPLNYFFIKEYSMIFKYERIATNRNITSITVKTPIDASVKYKSFHPRRQRKPSNLII